MSRQGGFLRRLDSAMMVAGRDEGEGGVSEA